MKRALLGVAGVLAIAGACAGGYVALDRRGVLADVPPGVRIGGREVPHDAALGAMLEATRQRLLSETVDVGFAGRFLAIPLGDLGVEVDVGATMALVHERVPRSVVERAKLALAEPNERLDVPLVFRIDEAKARLTLEALAPEVHRDPVSARLDIPAHARIPDVPGADLDVEKTVAALRALSSDGTDRVLMTQEKPIRAPVTADDLGAVVIEKVLASQETTFKTWGVGAQRAINIANAARYLDGYVIGPGATLSFNDVVGPRTVERGFTHAPEIVGDELQDGTGGGTCQLASTLHAASVFGALEILERHNHSRPSDYTSLGLDATVAYGKVDLKIRNPYSFPVLIHAFLPAKNAVRVELLGADPTAKVDYTWAVVRSEPFFRRITHKSFLTAGKIVKKQKGSKGRFVVSHVAITNADGTTRERSWLSDYRPVPELFWVGDGYDEGELPEMPEDATRVEHRGGS